MDLWLDNIIIIIYNNLGCNDIVEMQIKMKAVKLYLED